MPRQEAGIIDKISDALWLTLNHPDALRSPLTAAAGALSTYALQVRTGVARVRTYKLHEAYQHKPFGLLYPGSNRGSVGSVAPVLIGGSESEFQVGGWEWQQVGWRGQIISGGGHSMAMHALPATHVCFGLAFTGLECVAAGACPIQPFHAADAIPLDPTVGNPYLPYLACHTCRALIR